MAVSRFGCDKDDGHQPASEGVGEAVVVGFYNGIIGGRGTRVMTFQHDERDYFLPGGALLFLCYSAWSRVSIVLAAMVFPLFDVPWKR